MSKKEPVYFVALDLGAGSGRAMLAEYDGQHLKLEEVRRFPNHAISLPDGVYWDALFLYEEMQCGLAECALRTEGRLAGVAVDTWGVDYGLLDREGRLLANPRHYRDSRTENIFDEAFRLIPRDQLFEATGIQFMPFNTVFQLLAQRLASDPTLAAAHRLLWMPDLFNYWFTGRQAAERTIASTGQCWNPVTKDWADDVLKAFDIPKSLFAEHIAPATVLGPFRPALVERLGLRDTPIIAVGSHDTASAVAAVPLSGANEAYLSSGTWSLLGVERPAPVINALSLKYNFTNEAGLAGTTRLLKNISGLWIIQELRRGWANAGESFTYDEIDDMARQAEPFALFIDPDDPAFLPPGDMVARIADYAKRTGQTLPPGRGALVRAAYESLAFKYRRVLEMLEELTGQNIDTLHVVGGGAKNTFLNQCAASATGRTVRTGPSEATAAGNVLAQMLATGHVKSLAEGRDIIRASFSSDTYTPEMTETWSRAYIRFIELTQTQ